MNRGPEKVGAIGTAGECFWAGWAGTFYWIDPKEQMIGGVLMIQKYADPVTRGNRFRQLAYQAIVDITRSSSSNPWKYALSTLGSS